MAARRLLVEPRAPRSEKNERVKTKFSEEDQTCVSEAAAGAVAASSSYPEEGRVVLAAPRRKNSTRR